MAIQKVLRVQTYHVIRLNILNTSVIPGSRAGLKANLKKATNKMETTPGSAVSMEASFDPRMNPDVSGIYTASDEFRSLKSINKTSKLF